MRSQHLAARGHHHLEQQDLIARHPRDVHDCHLGLDPIADRLPRSHDEEFHGDQSTAMKASRFESHQSF